jgi:hypothetical protein
LCEAGSYVQVSSLLVKSRLRITHASPGLIPVKCGSRTSPPTERDRNGRGFSTTSRGSEPMGSVSRAVRLEAQLFNRRRS